MSVILPPKKLIVPSGAVFRHHKLPPELWDTWVVLLGITWVNRYEFSPPVSLDELVRLHKGTVQRRALIERLQRLEELAWLVVNRVSGGKNVYYPVVPPDGPAVRPPQGGPQKGERASDIRPERATDCPRSTEGGTEHNTSEGTGAVDNTGAINSIVVAAVDDSSFENQKKSTATTTTNNMTVVRSQEELDRIGDCLADLGLDDPGAREETLALEHVTVEYLEDWVIHRRLTGEHLGPGYYRMQIRRRRASQYTMSKRQRADYRHQKDEEWEMAAMRES